MVITQAVYSEGAAPMAGCAPADRTVRAHDAHVRSGGVGLELRDSWTSCIQCVQQRAGVRASGCRQGICFSSRAHWACGPLRGILGGAKLQSGPGAGWLLCEGWLPDYGLAAARVAAEGGGGQQRPGLVGGSPQGCAHACGMGCGDTEGGCD